MDVNYEKTIRQIINNNAELIIPIEKIGLYDDLSNSGINSITFIKIVVAIESEFGIEFNDNDLNPNNFRSLDCIINYVKEKLN